MPDSDNPCKRYGMSNHASSFGRVLIDPCPQVTADDLAFCVRNMLGGKEAD